MTSEQKAFLAAIKQRLAERGALLLATEAGVIEQLKAARTQTLAGLNSIWWGVGVSNVLILITAANPVGLMAGAMAGLGWWVSTADQRAFAEVCARERLTNPSLKCIYTTPA